MKDNNRVKEILDELKNLAESDFELHRISVLEKDLTEPPKAEQVDDAHQKFDGITYYKDKSGHYCTQVQIHRDIWRYYFGEIPENIHIHHRDHNSENNSIENLQPLTPSQHSRLHNEDKFYIRDCPVCGKNFSTKIIGDIYCSNACREKASEITNYCKFCGKFFPSSQRFKGGFCSKTCQNKYHRKSNMEIRQCVICGAEFSTYKYGKTQTCSQICSKRLLLQHFPPATKTCICEVCGKEFIQKKYKQNKTCSIECANISRRNTVLKYLTEQKSADSIAIESND